MEKPEDRPAPLGAGMPTPGMPTPAVSSEPSLLAQSPSDTPSVTPAEASQLATQSTAPADLLKALQHKQVIKACMCRTCVSHLYVALVTVCCYVTRLSLLSSLPCPADVGPQGSQAASRQLSGAWHKRCSSDSGQPADHVGRRAPPFAADLLVRQPHRWHDAAAARGAHAHSQRKPQATRHIWSTCNNVLQLRR